MLISLNSFISFQPFYISNIIFVCPDVWFVVPWYGASLLLACRFSGTVLKNEQKRVTVCCNDQLFYMIQKHFLFRLTRSDVDVQVGVTWKEKSTWFASRTHKYKYTGYKPAHAKSCVWLNALGPPPAAQMKGWKDGGWGGRLKDSKIHFPSPSVICSSWFEEEAVSKDLAVPHDELAMHNVRLPRIKTQIHIYCYTETNVDK